MPGLLQDLASVPKHLVIAKIGSVPRSGPRHQAQLAVQTLSCSQCRADPPWEQQLSNPATKVEKLGKIIAGKRHFFHTDMAMDSRARGKKMPLRPGVFSLEQGV